MAKIIKIKSELKQQRNRAGVFLAAAVIFAILFALGGVLLTAAMLLDRVTVHYSAPVILFAAAVLLWITALVSRKRLNILQSGVSGENETLDILKGLPRDYTVIANPVINNRGKINELDFLVVGKNGVFIIEAKNYSGTVEGKISSDNWRQIKRVNGETVEKTVKSPLKQAQYQLRRMRELLRDADIRAQVYSVVRFVNPNSRLALKYDEKTEVSVLGCDEDLVELIVQSEPKHRISQSTQSRIVKIFKK